MMRSLRHELSKVSRKTLAITAVVSSFLIAIAVFGVASQSADAIDAGLISEAQATSDIVINGFAGLLFATLMGAYLITGEEKSRTLGSTFLMNPDRGHVLRAKALAAAFIGFGIGVLSNGVAALVAFAALDYHGHVATFDQQAATTMLATTGVMTLAGPWGVAIGTFLRSSVVATVAIVVYTTMFETIVIEFLPSVGRFMPGGAQAAAMKDQLIEERLGQLPGTLLLLAYIAAAMAGATVFLRSREVRV